MAAFSVAALTLAISSCTSGSDSSASSASSSDASTTAASSDAATSTEASPPLAACELGSEVTSDEAVEGTHSGEDISVAPEIGTGYREGMTPVETTGYAVATANPLASAAACEVLRDGGTAADALVTAQFVLGLTEPQSSGLGGGGYILYYDAESNAVTAIDGRETAPVAADENYLIHVSADDQSAPVPDARRSGRSIGVPGIVAALGQLHESFGQTSWQDVLASPQQLATDGFAISPRMSASIASSAEDLSHDPEAAEYFLDADGEAKTPGTILQNPDYAETVRLIAEGGADAFYTGEIAASIVERATREVDGFTPSLMSTADLAAYTPETREALCAPYRDKIVCGMPPSSSGGVTVMETLGILNNFDLSQYPPTEVGLDGGLPDPEAIHLISEAERLAYADRDAYIGDPAFVEVPGGGVNELISEDYTRTRSELITPEESMGEAEAGLTGSPAMAPLPESGTSHISIIDSYGNAASLTTSVEAAFGSFHFTRGFILNNQLTDFSAEPLDDNGEPVANRVESAKRPRSSMSPMLVFNTSDTGEISDLNMVLGSPGGSLIIQFVVKTLVNIIDWGMDPQQAVSAPNFGAMNQPQTGLGKEHPLISANEDELVAELESKGHELNVTDQSSGLSALVKEGDTIVGGADPRREGVVLGGQTS
ncbi:gamma-glutamyltranspeptidase [Corynebacterium deserti GIMN1.010]|uniref:Glutathione hydrolase proenzyme n=2 Tax=Corynebacterium TaxID=1716 RepID=A0A0M4CHL4_9CORY|nr:gamma-glutamyltranspeptidase [Corynebacterium deserti GIMN1.010]